MAGLTIGELAEAAGVGVETIRFYERRNLISQPARPQSGYRRYSEDVTARVQFIRHAQELGFTLAEIDDLLTLRVNPSTRCEDVRARAEAKIGDIDEKIERLSRMREALVTITVTCSGSGPTSECPILDALDSNSKKGR